MVWTIFGYNGTTPIRWILTKLKAIKYIALLDKVLLQYRDRFAESTVLIVLLKVVYPKSIHVIKCSAINFETKPIENIWGIMVRKVYSNWRQFSSINELQA